MLMPLAVPPADVETVLLQHPGVRDAGVVGVWSDELGTEVPRHVLFHSGSGCMLISRQGVRGTKGRENSPGYWRGRFLQECHKMGGRPRQQVFASQRRYSIHFLCSYRMADGLTGIFIADSIPRGVDGKVFRKDLRKLVGGAVIFRSLL